VISYIFTSLLSYSINEYEEDLQFGISNKYIELRIKENTSLLNDYYEIIFMSSSSKYIPTSGQCFSRNAELLPYWANIIVSSYIFDDRTPSFGYYDYKLIVNKPHRLILDCYDIKVGYDIKLGKIK